MNEKQLAQMVYDHFSDIKNQYPYDDYDGWCRVCGSEQNTNRPDPHKPDCTIPKMLELAKKILGEE